ncbi:MAG: YSIRK-type signal peptide-containing protein [Staphylococcus sp.]|nr:YSIRK-type signal peptide-containing protein [Staphylococcus sp.]
MKNHLFKVNQRQRYAIRKFSVGIGSTLIDVTLFLGMQNHAHAAENSESKTQQNTEENNASSTPNQQATSPMLN